MIRSLAARQPAIASVAPVAALSALGLLTAAMGLRAATFVVGAPTPLLVVLAPLVVLLARRSKDQRRAIVIAGAALAVNLATEAAASTAQVALLHL